VTQDTAVFRLTHAVGIAALVLTVNWLWKPGFYENLGLLVSVTLVYAVVMVRGFDVQTEN